MQQWCTECGGGGIGVPDPAKATLVAQADLDDDERRYEQAYRRDVAQADLKCILVPVHHLQRRLDARNVPVDVRDLHSSESDLLRTPTAQLLMG